MAKKEKTPETWKEMLEKIKSGKVRMIGKPQQHPMTLEELEEFQESYRKALVKNIYQRASERK